jgi:hypothetical protein
VGRGKIYLVRAAAAEAEVEVLVLTLEEKAKRKVARMMTVPKAKTR